MADLFRALQNDEDAVEAKIATVKSKLMLIAIMFNELTTKSENGTDLNADSIEAELAGMDKAIEEAAAQIEVI